MKSVVALLSSVVLPSLVLLSSCASAPPSTASLSEPERKALFAAQLVDDPNAALCEQLVERLDADDLEALTPFLDRPALVERALTMTPQADDVAAGWRANAERIENLSRLYRPRGTQYYCLGTVPFHGDEVLALRGRAPNGKWSHVLLHLRPGQPRPIDDWFVVETGVWHSALQMFFEDPRYAPFADFHRQALAGSYDGRYEETLAAWQTLPADVRLQPILFAHAINAVMTVTPAGSELDSTRFKAIAKSIDTVFAEPLTRASWNVIFRARLHDVEGAMIAVDALTTPLRDPLADELKDWVRARP